VYLFGYGSPPRTSHLQKLAVNKTIVLSPA
jgi:hypothetical protein